MTGTDKESLSFIPIPALIIIVLALYLIVKPSVFFEPTWLLPITNTVFVTLVCFIVAYIAMRNYKATGRIQILLLGCGVLAIGTGGAVAGWLRSVPGAGANLNVTIYNTGALIGAIFHFVAALLLVAGISPEAGSRREKFWLAFSYVGLILFMALLTVASLKGMIPPFFIQGVGPTYLRQVVLGTAAILFAFSFLIFMGSYLRNREVFLYWYSAALALTAISLTAFFIQSAVGSPIGWAGRFSQYLGGVYFLIAVIMAIRSAQLRRTSFDNILTASLSPAEEKFRALAEHSPDMIERFDRERKYIYVNQTGLRLYGKPASSMIGRTIEEMGLPEPYVSLLKQGIQTVFETGRPMEVEHYIPAENGTKFYQSRCVPEFGVDGAVVNVLVVSRDLTSRKRAEEALRQSEERFRTFSEATFEGIVLSEQGRILDCNEQFARMTGYERSELVGKPIEPLILPEDRRRVLDSILAGFESVTEHRLVRKNGTIGVVEGHGKTLPYEGRGRRYAAIRDITERKRAEEALKRSEENSRLLIKYAPSMLYEIDFNPPAFKSVNEAMCHYLGYTREELLAMNPFDLLDEEGKTLFRNRIKRISAGEPLSDSVEYKSRARDGRELHTVLNITFTYKDGKPEGAVVVAHDITERKMAEERIARLTKLYVVLSRVNETIVRTRDEGVLLREVCRIVAEEGEFPLVWFGQVNGRQVTPAASHGSAVDYLKEIEVEVDGDMGIGPTGTCIREDRPVVNDDFDTNLSTAPWRGQALRYGFRGSGAFPLHRQGTVVGALTLYTPNPGAFDTEQVNLLEALCADVSYALDAMHQEKLRTEAENTLRQRTLELLQLTETLEMRVQERTQELRAINEELRAENEERLRVEIELRESENDLRQLSAALLTAQERERKLIAQEIHDSMGASLAAAKFKVEAALNQMADGNPQTGAALESVVPIIQGAIEEARRIQMSLRPSILDDLGILATINWFSRQFQSTYSHIRMKQEIEIQEHEVPNSLKIVIYRVLQEALNNIAKHSKASAVLLFLRKNSQAMELIIRDSGQGFDLEEAFSRKGTARGLGLDSMRERVELSGGSFIIESRKGAGTVIRATWPLNR
jgi:PAS domain S-box-containing protein